MAVRINILFLFAALILFLLLSANSAADDGDDVIEVIKNVKKNKKVQDLGMFALEQINKKVSSSELLAFCGVAKAKRWHGLDGWDYYFLIKSEKVVEKIKGSLNVYVYTSSYGNGKTVKAGIFKPNHA